MAITIRHALAQVKADLPGWIETHVLDDLAQHPGHVWRRRELDPLTTIMLFITQVLHGNTAIVHLRHLAGMTCSATAYCNARMRLPLTLLQYVSEQVTRQLLTEAQQADRWLGHRIWHADGTSFSMPDTPELQNTFGQPGAQAAGCGFPVASLLVLCNAAGFITRTLASPLRTHEAAQLPHLHEQLEAGDVLVYDRAGCSYMHLALLFQRNLHAIVRMHQRKIVRFRRARRHAGKYPKAQRAGRPTSQWLKRLGQCDQLVRWFKPKQRPRWMTSEQYDALPDSLVVRELRYAVRRKGFRSTSVTLVTTLTDGERYTTAELAQQYLERWQIEVNFRHLKQTMNMNVLKCKTQQGVLKELAAFVLVYNLVRLVMLRAAKRQHVPAARISFVDALRWLCEARHGRAWLDLVVNPSRKDRIEPRAIKRRMKPYALMTKPRDVLRQQLMSTRLVA